MCAFSPLLISCASLDSFFLRHSLIQRRQALSTNHTRGSGTTARTCLISPRSSSVSRSSLIATPHDTLLQSPSAAKDYCQIAPADPSCSASRQVSGCSVVSTLSLCMNHRRKCVSLFQRHQSHLQVGRWRTGGLWLLGRLYAILVARIHPPSSQTHVFRVMLFAPLSTACGVDGQACLWYTACLWSSVEPSTLNKTAL